jgi:hypothetical protein
MWGRFRGVALLVVVVVVVVVTSVAVVAEVGWTDRGWIGINISRDNGGKCERRGYVLPSQQHKYVHMIRSVTLST